jgi:signal transduction histidine kinase
MLPKKLSYYNYFLMLSTVLIAGYYVTSLFFLKKTSYSGAQADIYAQISDSADDILKSAYIMDANAHGYLLTANLENYKKFKNAKCSMDQHFSLLWQQCEQHNLAQDHLQKLETLISSKKEIISHLVSADSTHLMHNDLRIESIQKGAIIADSITIILNKIRSESADLRTENQNNAIVSTRNAMFMLSFFGIVMLAIVVISFDKLKTEIQQNEKQKEEIVQINSELKSLNENLENFAYVASHDLNEPLRKIRTFGDLIQEDIANDEPDYEKIVHHIQRMQVSAERMQDLITDLLSYSRASIDAPKSPIDLKDVIDDVINDLQTLIQENKASINIGNLPQRIQGHDVQLRQLFQNLIANAIKFHKKNVPPVIDIQSEKVKGDKINAPEGRIKLEHTYHKITVTDNGIGFDEKYTEKIFAVFQRLHGKNEYQGTGIGLSICKKITENHKGFITAKSKEGQGATFIIYLPE